MKKSGATLGDLRVCIEEEIYVITERYRKFFEDVAAGGGSSGAKASWAAEYHKMMEKEIAPLRRTLIDLKKMETGS